MFLGSGDAIIQLLIYLLIFVCHQIRRTLCFCFVLFFLFLQLFPDEKEGKKERKKVKKKSEIKNRMENLKMISFVVLFSFERHLWYNL